MNNEDSSKFLVVYDKPSSSDYCRGCLMESYSSDTGKQTFYNVSGVINFCVEKLSKPLGCGEDGYDITIYKDGCGFDDHITFYSSGESGGVPYWDGDGEADAIIQGVKVGLEVKKKEREEEKKKKENEEKRRERKEKEREFARLKKELGK